MMHSVPHFTPDNFGARVITDTTDIPILQKHYSAVVQANNVLPGRHIDWEDPIPKEKLENAIEDRSIYVVQSRQETGRAITRSRIWGSFILNSDHSFGKLAVNAHDLGKGFGRLVVIPWIQRIGREVLGASELSFDALPDLHPYYHSIGAVKTGESDFYSKTAGKVVTLYDYTLPTGSDTHF